MSNFQNSRIFYTDEELELRDKAHEFAEEKIVPVNKEIEKGNYDPIRKLILEMGKEQILAPLHPKKYGGIEMGVIGDTIVAEEISRVNFALDLSRIATIALFGMPVQRFGTEEQKQKYLIPVIKGEKIGCIGITEPNVGSDTAGMKTTAVKEGDYYIINGEKRFITNGPEADFINLYAITTPLPKVHPKRGMSTFIVDTKLKGFRTEKRYNTCGLKGSAIGHLKFEDMAVPVENLLGEENKGFQILMDELNSERCCIAGQGVGVGRAALEVAVEYSQHRMQFDRHIRFFEGVSFMIADMATRVEASRALTVQAARSLDKLGNIPSTKICAMAKNFASLSASQNATDAIGILGGIGYTDEYPAERYYRDSKLLEIGGGTVNVHQYIIQREVYKEFGYY